MDKTFRRGGDLTPMGEYYLALDHHGRWPNIDTAKIAEDPKASYLYAKNVLHAPFPEGESAIAQDPGYSFGYACMIKGRFPEAEPVIAKSPWREKYLDLFPEARAEWNVLGLSDWFESVKQVIDATLIEAKNPRLGRCFELAGRYVSEHPDATLVHGRLTNPFARGMKELDHAWVEEGDRIFDPVMGSHWDKEAYERLFQVRVYKRYSHEEVLNMTLEREHW